MPLSTRRFATLFATLALAAVAVSCGTSAPVTPDRGSDAYLQQQLALLDSMSLPDGAEAAVWNELTGSLRQQLQTRLDSKATLAAPTSNGSRAVLTLDEPGELLSWGFASQGDYDQNGEVNVADLTPIAMHFQAVGPFARSTARSVIDGNSDGEINIADLTPIAQNLGATLFSYSVYRGNDMGDVPSTNSGPNGADAALLGTVNLGVAIGDAKQARLGFTFSTGAIPANAVYWVRPHDAGDGAGNEGTSSTAAGPGAIQPGGSVDGTVETDANVALAGVTMTLSGASTFNTTTAADGSFSFAAVPAGSYTLTPSLANCSFTPPSRSVTAGSGNGQDFTASLDIPGSPYGFTIDDPFNPGTPAAVRFEKGTAIDIFVDNTGLTIPGWQSSFDAAVRDASMIWNQVGQPWGLFTIRQTTVEADAEIIFSWVPPFSDPLSPGKFAETISGISSPPPTYSVPVPIHVATANDFGPATDAVIRMITVHEMGHALGLLGHSNLDTDIMFPIVGGFEQPSPRDLLTMYTLYNSPPDFTAGARGTSSVEPGETYTIRME
jgi:hypothetical protein